MASPILTLKDSISRAAFQIAPERAKELADQIDLSKLTLEFSSANKFSIEVLLVSQLVKLPIPALEYLWCCAHAFWTFYQAVLEAQSNNASQVDLAANPRSAKAIELLNWSRQNMEIPGLTPWPEGMPRPDAEHEHASEIHVANELFLCAISWIIHHEIAHILLNHGQFQANSDVQLEKDADNKATDWILSQSTIELEQQKRQLGIITALLAIQYLDKPTDADSYVETHPPAVERIHYSLDRAGTEDDSVICAFATTALQFHLGQFGIQASLEGDSISDILSGFLAAFATHNRNSRGIAAGEKTPNIPEPYIRHDFQNKTNQTEIVQVEDKKGGKHYLLVETTEYSTRLQRENEIINLSGTISCSVQYLFGSKHQYIGKTVSSMGGKAEAYSMQVRITNGQVMINQDDLRSMGIGTYLMNKIITWAKQFDPNYRVQTVNIVINDAGPDNRDRRNNLYENFGLRFNYREENGIQKASGASLAELTVADLLCYQHLKGFETQTPFTALSELGRHVEQIIGNHKSLLTRLRNTNRKPPANSGCFLIQAEISGCQRCGSNSPIRLLG